MKKPLLSTQTGNLVCDGESAEKYFPILKAAGFEAVDFGINGVIGNDNLWKRKRFPVFDLPHDEMLEFFGRIKAAADKNGIVFGQMHSHHPTLIPKDEPDYNAYLYECLEKEIEIAGLLSCPYIVIHPVFSGVPGAWSTEYEHDRTFEVMTGVIPLLKKYGVKACLENMWYSDNGKIYASCCTDWDVVNAWIDELNAIAGEELFGFCFDSGHAVLVSSDPAKGIAAVGKRIMTLHLHDVDGVHDSHTMPYVGVANWQRIMEALSSIGYSGSINFEAANAWKMFPEPLYPDAIKLLGSVGRYFIDTYFKDTETDGN